jgi:hypothetical protein
MPTDEHGDIKIWCHSIFGARTRKGLVGLTVGDRMPVLHVARRGSQRGR